MTPQAVQRRSGRPPHQRGRADGVVRAPAAPDESLEALTERVLCDMVLRARSTAGVTAALRTALDALGPLLGRRSIAVEHAGAETVRWGEGHGAPGTAGTTLPGGARLTYGPAQAPPTAGQERALGRLAEVVGELLRTDASQQVTLAASCRAERARLAEQIHDEAIQLLFAAEMELGLAGAGAGPHAARAHELVARAQGSLRGLVDQAERAQADLLQGLDAMACDLEADFGCRIALHAAPGVRARTATLAAAEVATVVRLVRESALNALKHGATDRVAVVVRASAGDRLVVVVTDEGLGLSPSAEPSHGMRSLQCAMSACGGSFRIGPRPRGGTRVVATMPL
ncbi:hypothetical protein FSW04_20450 [Baekduia soli]|uniref:Uncharacterized protein n=1 Tax=Baekduia soli TaxID=496014 RepID=A0A5B8UAL7_9ACTN|nr:ATP-binding protein [Baekduia soli]QEC49712.1 hypothetical protein FSW04_20450 [Baekduia soli]